MLIAFISGSYRDSRGDYYVRRNIQRAENTAAEVAKQGFGVIVPHRNTGLWSGLVEESYFPALGLELLRRSDFIVVVPSLFGLKNWSESQGTQAEVQEANKLGKEVFFYPDFFMNSAGNPSRAPDRTWELE